MVLCSLQSKKILDSYYQWLQDLLFSIEHIWINIVWSVYLALLQKNIIAQKMKFSIKDFFSKCYQIRNKQRIWSHLLKKSLMENFIFPCSVCYISNLVVFPFYILVLGQQFIVLLRFFTGNCGFGHIYWRNPSWKTSFFLHCHILCILPFLNLCIKP